MIELEKIPNELRRLPQWVNWRYEQKPGESKHTKVPINSRTGKRASTTNPATWSTFEEARARSSREGVDGLGFVFNGNFIGIDVDNAIDPATQTLKLWAKKIVASVHTYAELSPSKTGAHLISAGCLPDGWRGLNRAYEDGKVEIYSSGRFFTMTGCHIEDTPCKPEDRRNEVNELYRRVSGATNTAASQRHPTFGPAALTDDDLIEKAKAAKNGAKFSRLWSGDTSDHGGDDSRADLALCTILSFWTDKDAAGVDRLFRKSGLFRKKWDRADYRERTIRAAIDKTSETYSSREERPRRTDNKRFESPENVTKILRPTQYSDDALADLFSAKYARDFVYVDEWGWLLWTANRWKRVPDVVVMGHARRICRQQSACCKDDGTLHEKSRETLARSLSSAKVVAAVVKLAANDHRHYRLVSQFDSDLWLFNTPGGTIDLRTGVLREHNPEDLITKIANATPRGESPTWMTFLNRITAGNREMQSYLQRLAGYAMAGDPSEECLDFFYGDGGNGKGTFLKTLQYSFGEYGTTAATETFLEAKGDRHPTDIAKLAGARLVVAQEVDQGQYWNESRLKTMTGRDEMTARFMRRDLFDFVPQFTLIISGNNKPSLKTVDEAWRRRFHLVPFLVTIPKEERNNNLKTELQAEADGIMNWCLAGCLDWQRQRLNPPETVLGATTDYLESEDTFGMWIEECCLQGNDGYEEPVAWLYTSHRQWREERGERPFGTKGFSQLLLKAGFQPGKRSTRVFRGLRLTDPERVRARVIIDAKRAWASTTPKDYVD
jgi:putative DNA primase/helicase